MESPSPISIVQRVYVAFAAGDLATVLSLCSPDVVVTQDPRLPWGGQHVGHDGVTEFGVQLITNIESSVTMEHMFEAGADVVQHGRTSGTVLANGTAFDIPECHVWTVQDGLVTRAQFFIDSTAMLAALHQ
jgi:uncharacterized protein